MSFVYPRTIKVTRPRGQTGVGAQDDYAADLPANESVVVPCARASIQARTASGRDPVGLPGDGAMQTWRVLTPRGDIKLGTVKNRDIVTDDLGNRFQVCADYGNSLGCNFIVTRLEP